MCGRVVLTTVQTTPICRFSWALAFGLKIWREMNPLCAHRACIADLTA